MLKRLVTSINSLIDNLLGFFQVVASECAGTVLLAHGVHTEAVLQWIYAKKKQPAASAEIDSPLVNENCAVCGDCQILSYWDIDVSGLACDECAGFLAGAKNVLVANEFETPSYILIVEDP
jgi:hypothetical protein